MDEAGDKYSGNAQLTDQILNAEFTVDEIYLRVKELKNRKACGIDKISNEYIKSTFEKMKFVYVDLFNSTFGSSHSASSAYQKWPTRYSDSNAGASTQASPTSHPFKV